MGLFNNLFGKGSKPDSISVAAEKDTLYLPVEGEVIPLEQIKDGVFSEGILGPGCGIIPNEGIIYAPANGEITQVADTKHAVGLTTEDGIEVLIHVGMDTVEMNGEGFEPLVKEGQKVKCGQPLLKFSIDKVKAAGHPITTAFVVTNSDDLGGISTLGTGSMHKLSAVVKVTR